MHQQKRPPFPAVPLLTGQHSGLEDSCKMSDVPYITLEELKKEIDLLSQFKINVFHWHLTENQAWRLESKIYPELNAPENMT